MKTIIYFSVFAAVLNSCNKIEETINDSVNTARENAHKKANELVQETVNEQLNKYVNATSIKFDSVFPHQNNLLIENAVGKKVAFPNGSPFYVFKYKTSNRDELLKTLVEQPTSDETQSKKEFDKIDGSTLIEKLTFFRKFLPENTIDTGFLDEIKNDKNIEYYKVKRFPNSSTLIYNPKSGMVYQFVEVKK